MSALPPLPCYLNGEFTVLEGQYAKRKIFTLIGLYSAKGPEWAKMGRSFVRGIATMGNPAREGAATPTEQPVSAQ